MLDGYLPEIEIQTEMKIFETRTEFQQICLSENKLQQ